MICAQPGHLTHRPSGTRLALSSAGAIGLRVFLNHAIQTISLVPDCRLSFVRGT